MDLEVRSPIPVSIIHAARLIRDALLDVLGQQPGVWMVGAFGSGQDALAQPRADGEIVLYDLTTQHRDGPSLVAALREQHLGTEVLIFDVTDDDQAIIECVRAGASGCILQEASAEDMLAAIRSVALGTPPASPRVITTLFSYVVRLQTGDDSPPLSPLTPREEQILQLIAAGLTNPEIAQKLSLQHQTVKNYVHVILQKLHLRTRLELIRSLRSGKR
jgi:two-component system nitrate/nitrite response regulator NarL